MLRKGTAEHGSSTAACKLPCCKAWETADMHYGAHPELFEGDEQSSCQHTDKPSVHVLIGRPFYPQQTCLKDTSSDSCCGSSARSLPHEFGTCRSSLGAIPRQKTSFLRPYQQNKQLLLKEPVTTIRGIPDLVRGE